MKVSSKRLIAPIVIVVLLIAVLTFGLQKLEVKQTSSGLDYKEQLFKEDELGVVNITISDENWQTILDDPTAEEYVEADVSVNGTTYESVGVRAKGNSSLSSVASSDSNRYSLKIDFSEYNSSQTYYGLQKLNLNNNYNDTTQMREFVSYELMEQMGIATPAHSYVKVMVNGEYYGLMLAVEEVADTFVQTNFATSEGFLFKPESTGSDLAYISDDTDDYDFFTEVKMNEEEAKSESNIIQMVKELSEGDTSSIDVDEVAKYFALNTALVNNDSYVGQFKHNYYLYENKEGIFQIIPWDYNLAFGGFGGGGQMGGMPGATVDVENMEATDEAANDQAADTQAQDENAQQVQGTTPPAMPNGEAPAQGMDPGNGEPPTMGQVPTEETAPENGEAPTEGTAPTLGQTPNDTTDEANADGEENAQTDKQNVAFGGDMGGDMLADSNINFSITEPVSGTTVEERPLLQMVLENEDVRALYDQYLEQIATEVLTEENILSITEPLKELLYEAVDEDPSKFGTTEEFVNAVSGEQSLAQFAKLRSESILGQLSGEVEGVSGAGSMGVGGMGGQMPDMNGEMPAMPGANGQVDDTASDAQQQTGQMPPEGQAPPGNGEMPAGVMPGGGANANDDANTQDDRGGGRGEMNGDMANMGDPANMNGKAEEEVKQPLSKSTIITIASSLLVLLCALGFVIFVSNRKYKK